MLSTRAPFQAATVSRTTVRGARLIVQVRPTKAADFRGLDNAEILQKVDELKKEKLRLQYMQKTRGNMLNPGSVSDATSLLCCPICTSSSSGSSNGHTRPCLLYSYQPTLQNLEDTQPHSLKRIVTVMVCRRTTQMQCR
jgi:ribosomal protein L29